MKIHKQGSGRPMLGSGRSMQGSSRSRKGSGGSRKGSGRSRKGSGRSMKGSVLAGPLPLFRTCQLWLLDVSPPPIGGIYSHAA